MLVKALLLVLREGMFTAFQGLFTVAWNLANHVKSPVEAPNHWEIEVIKLEKSSTETQNSWVKSWNRAWNLKSRAKSEITSEIMKSLKSHVKSEIKVWFLKNWNLVRYTGPCRTPRFGGSRWNPGSQQTQVRWKWINRHHKNSAVKGLESAGAICLLCMLLCIRLAFHEKCCFELFHFFRLVTNRWFWVLLIHVIIKGNFKLYFLISVWALYCVYTDTVYIALVWNLTSFSRLHPFAQMLARATVTQWF